MFFMVGARSCRKPTLERSSQDGGLSFVVEEAGSYNGPAGRRTRPTLTMRRVSEGQEIRKVGAGETCAFCILWLFNSLVDAVNFRRYL